MFFPHNNDPPHQENYICWQFLCGLCGTQAVTFTWNPPASDTGADGSAGCDDVALQACWLKVCQHAQNLMPFAHLLQRAHGCTVQHHIDSQEANLMTGCPHLKCFLPHLGFPKSIHHSAVRAGSALKVQLTELMKYLGSQRPRCLFGTAHDSLVAKADLCSLVYLAQVLCTLRLSVQLKPKHIKVRSVHPCCRPMILTTPLS